MMNNHLTGCEVCEAFFDALYHTHDTQVLLHCLTDDITWSGDSEMVSATGKLSVLFILEYATKNYFQNHRLKSMKLNEKQIRQGICLVEGFLLLGDDVSEDMRFRFAALCTKNDEQYQICNMQFHMLKSMNKQSYAIDRMLNSLFDAMPFSVVIFEQSDAKLNLIYFNEAFTKCVSMSKAECKTALDEAPFAFADPNSRDTLKQAVYSLLGSGSFTCEPAKVKIGKATPSRWVSVMSSVFHWGDQRAFIVLSLVDITEEIEEQRLLRATIANIPASICMFEIDGQRIRHTFLSEGFPKELGLQSEDFYGDVDFKLIHPDDLELVKKAYHGVLNGAETIDIEFRAGKKQGDYIWTKLTAKRVLNELGEPMYFGVYLNVDDKVRLAKEIVALKDEMEDMITSLPCGVALFVYQDGQITPGFFSDQLRALFGMNRNDYASGFSTEMPLGYLTDPELMERLKSYIQEKRTDSETILVKKSHQDGNPFWLRIIFRATHVQSASHLYLAISDATQEVLENQANLWKQERYRILAEALNGIVFDYNPTDDVLTYEVFSQKQTGEQKIAGPLNHILLENCQIFEEIQMVRDLFTRLAKTATRGTMDIHVKRASNEFRWYRLYYVSLEGADGSIFRILGRLEDIQKEKEQEQFALARASIVTQHALNVGSNTLYSGLFDLHDGVRLRTDTDISSNGTPKAKTFLETLMLICDKLDDSSDIGIILREANELNVERDNYTRSGKDFVIKYSFPKSENSIWVKLTITTICDEPTKQRFASVTLSDYNEQKNKEIAAWNQVNIDDLTELLNKRSFEEKLQKFLSEHRTRHTIQAIACIEIDSLKWINERYGYELGDEIIIKSGQVIHAALQTGDFACRTFGGTFMICLTDLQNESVMEERLRIISLALQWPIGEDKVTSVHIGCVIMSGDKDNEKKLITQVSEALHSAKRCEAKYVCVSSDEMIEGIINEEVTYEVEVSGNADPEIFIRTFGHFDVFINNKPVYFNYPKAKELLALLIDRKGGYLSAIDAISCLWEDLPANKKAFAKYRQTAMQLKIILEKNGIQHLVESKNGMRRVMIEHFTCDYYMFTRGEENEEHSYFGQYMMDYSWAEETIAALNERKDTRTLI